MVVLNAAGPDIDAFGPFGQLIKMLLPRAGNVGLYGPDAVPIWMFYGCEGLDAHALVAQLLEEGPEQIPRTGRVMATQGGERVCLFRLCGGADETLLGVLAVELGEGATPSTLVPSLLQPVVVCIESRMNLERNVRSLSAPQATAIASDSADLELLLAVDDHAAGTHNALQQLVQGCVEHLDCEMGGLVLPEQKLTICGHHGTTVSQDVAATVLTRTYRHLLAWARLHDRPMVVNRVLEQPGAAAPAYKILCCPIHDLDQRVTGILGMFRSPLAADFQQRDERILQLLSRKAISLLDSSYDRFTGLLNRLAFERQVQARLDESPTRVAHCLLYIDIDKLHVVNNAFGFEAGDDVIRRFADVLRDQLGDQDLIGRIAGDRFAILLVDRCLEESRGLAESLREAAGSLRYLKGDRTVPISVSIGLAPCACGGQRFSHALAVAEVACKAAKDRGRNRVEVYEDNDVSIVNRHNDMYWFTRLQDALRENQFRLYAQPICDLRTASLDPVAFEVLVRLQHGNGKLVAPDRFLSAAVRYQLMPAIDRWVFCKTLGALQDYVPVLSDRALSFAINISGQSLGSDGFLQFLVSHLRSSGVPPNHLCLEISETGAVANLEQAEQFIRAMTDLGCQFALDDFGSGLSSFAYLRNLPVQTLKIDGSFVREAAANQISESMVVAIAQVAKVMGLRTIAEYVESEDVAAKMREIDVDYGQGFHLGRPQPLNNVLADLAASSPREVVVAG